MVAEVIDQFNFGEAFFWFAFAAAAYFALRGRSRWRERGTLAGLIIIFGISDLVEVHTGAWWRPWWLGMGKIALAVAAVVICLRIWRRGGHAGSRGVRTNQK